MLGTGRCVSRKDIAFPHFSALIEWHVCAMNSTAQRAAEPRADDKADMRPELKHADGPKKNHRAPGGHAVVR